MLKLVPRPFGHPGVRVASSTAGVLRVCQEKAQDTRREGNTGAHLQPHLPAVRVCVSVCVHGVCMKGQCMREGGVL